MPRRIRALHILIACVLVLTGCTFRDEAAPTPEGSIQWDESPYASPSANLRPTPDVSATPVHAEATPLPGATPEGTPIATPISSLDEDACTDRCLIRVRTDDASGLGRASYVYESYVYEEWSWVVVAPETVGSLRESGVAAYLVSDSSDTRPLYAVRQPEGEQVDPHIGAMGEVLDFVGRQAIVEVPAYPPVVTQITGHGFWVEKVMPAPPAPDQIAETGTVGPLADIELGALMTDVDGSRIEANMSTLQASSSTDGTGIGTRHYTQPGNVMAAEWLFHELELLGLNVWYEDFLSPHGQLSSNVVAEVPGHDDSAVYGLMAHFDSIADSMDSAPGADDNGSGVSAVLEIANVLSRYELKHPVRIAFVNAEETMIVGSMDWAANLVRDQVPIEGVFNMDTVANDDYGMRMILNSGPQSSWMSDLLVRVNNEYGLGQDLWVYQSESIVADDNMLRNQGIEAVLVARLLADEYGVHHSTHDTMETASVPLTIDATLLVLLALGSVVQ